MKGLIGMVGMAAMGGMGGFETPYMRQPGYQKAKRSSEVSRMLIEKAEEKRECKATIRAARATI